MNPDHPAERIAALVERLGRLARGRRHQGGMDPAQWEALRFLAVANRYSRSPATVAEFLGSTRGTVSQTLNALSRQRLIARKSNPRDGRGVVLELTERGRNRVGEDPMNELVAAAAALDVAQQVATAAGLTAILRGLQRESGFRGFGQCASCRHFRRNDATGEPGGPHRCGLTREPLSGADSLLLCREHEPNAA